MAYRSGSGNSSSSNGAVFTLGGTGMAQQSSSRPSSTATSNSNTNTTTNGSSTAASSLLSAFNNPPNSQRNGAGGAGSASSAATTGLGMASTPQQAQAAQAAFMNAGPNRTVSNVGQQAAQGTMSIGGPVGGAGTGHGFGSPANNPGSLAADLNLDPSDFPALGGGAGGGIGANSTSNQPLLSSYATQASAGSIAANAAQQAFFSSQQQQQQNQQGLPNREFSADDFPALGGGNLSLDGLNGHSSLAARSVQEQASAAAALAHRQNLLGTMSAGAQNQARSLSNAAASTVFPQMGSGVSAGSAVADDAKRNYATKLSAAQIGQGSQAQQLGYAIGSPLPPSSSSPLYNHSSSNQSPSPSPNPQPRGAMNGISQALDSLSSNGAGSGQHTSPSLQNAASGTGPQRIGSGLIGSGSGGGLPPQLSNLLLQQHLQQQQQHNSPLQQQRHQQDASQLLQGTGQTNLPQTPAQQVLMSPADRFGLLGLLNIIKLSADPDYAMLSLGTDLEKLGLDLGSTGNLHSTFITPWADPDSISSTNIEPEFQLPSCYNVQPPPASSKVGAFSDETLFFIFYSQPRDAMQEAAAEQLYKRNWRYHKDLHLWLTKDVGSEPSQKTATYERGSYIFFDPNSWEKVQKEFVLVFEHLETRHRGTGQAIQQPGSSAQQQQQQQQTQQPQYANLPGLAA